MKLYRSLPLIQCMLFLQSIVYYVKLEQPGFNQCVCRQAHIISISSPSSIISRISAMLTHNICSLMIYIYRRISPNHFLHPLQFWLSLLQYVVDGDATGTYTQVLMVAPSGPPDIDRIGGKLEFRFFRIRVISCRLKLSIHLCVHVCACAVSINKFSRVIV